MREQKRGSAGDVQGSKGGNEGSNAKAGDHGAVQKANNAADQQRDRDGSERAHRMTKQANGEQASGDHARESCDGSNR